MNYDTLLTAAHDYISAYNDVRRTFPYGFTLWDSTLLHSEAAQKSICYDRYEAVFHTLCECAGIPQEMIAVIALLLTAIDGAFAPIAPFADVAMYISAAMTVWSGVDYIQKNFDCIRDM